jgi:antitoxin component YwqK of YwqJK toxin-antitoxin module
MGGSGWAVGGCSMKAKPSVKSEVAREHIEYHKDGSVRAKGQTLNGELTGYWEWFRKNGTKMRSGYFEAGQQVGQWTTYDQKGEVYKLTIIKRDFKS